MWDWRQGWTHRASSLFSPDQHGQTIKIADGSHYSERDSEATSFAVQMEVILTVIES